MTFLQPWMLLAAPLVALPLIIHLINQRRFQTMPWAAMMFLLTANRMSRGYARLRQWLILAFRMLAIAGLLFVISRPLASGWLGAAAGGSADATLVLLDRSPSMQQIGAGTATSKLDTAKRKLRDTLGTLGTSRVVLIDSGSTEARELESLDGLVDSPGTGPAGNTADVAAMLQEAYSYVKASAWAAPRCGSCRTCVKATGMRAADAGRRFVIPSKPSRKRLGFTCCPTPNRRPKT